MPLLLVHQVITSKMPVLLVHQVITSKMPVLLVHQVITSKMPVLLLETYKYVLGLDVAVDDHVGMEINHGQAQLVGT